MFFTRWGIFSAVFPAYINKHKVNEPNVSLQTDCHGLEDILLCLQNSVSDGLEWPWIRFLFNCVSLFSVASTIEYVTVPLLFDLPARLHFLNWEDTTLTDYFHKSCSGPQWTWCKFGMWKSKICRLSLTETQMTPGWTRTDRVKVSLDHSECNHLKSRKVISSYVGQNLKGRCVSF